MTRKASHAELQWRLWWLGEGEYKEYGRRNPEARHLTGAPEEIPAEWWDALSDFLARRHGRKLHKHKPVGIPLPNLAWHETRNQSARLHGVTPYLIVIHRPVGEYGPSINWLRNRRSQASAHVITEGKGTGVDVATQLVPWDRKAWACAAFNSVSYNIEVDDDAWDGGDLGAFMTAARITAFICHKTGIPAVWSRNPHSSPGIIRHYDLGRAGGGHTDPTTSTALWKKFITQVEHELNRGGFRRDWGHGTFERISH